MFQKLPNPDNVPGLVTTGYQRQNTNMFAIQAGIDTTEPFDDGTAITILVGGVVEFNGTLFKVSQEIVIQKPISARAYWIALTDNGNNTASARLVERPGKWYPTKQGCYLNDGSRVLNYVSLGDISNPPVSGEVYSKTTKGRSKTRLKKGWYFANIASGKAGNGGNGNNGISGTTVSGGAGGVPTYSQFARAVFFHKGKKNISIKVGGDGFPGGAGGTGYQGKGSGGGGATGDGEESSVNDIKTEISTGRGGDGGNSLSSYPGAGGGGGNRGGNGGTGASGVVGGDGGAGKNGNGTAGNGGTAGIGGAAGLYEQGNANAYGGASNFLFSGINTPTTRIGGFGGGTLKSNGILNGENGGNSSTAIGGTGAGGGGQGADGKWRFDGDTNAGYVKIYALGE